MSWHDSFLVTFIVTLISVVFRKRADSAGMAVLQQRAGHGKAEPRSYLGSERASPTEIKF